MPFSDVIDDYSNGSVGTLTDVNGDSVGYTVTGTAPTTDWNDLDGGARVNADGSQTFTVTFDEPVVGAAMQISGSDSNEIYYIEVDGVAVNLQTLIDNGDVTLTQSGAQSHEIGPDGSISGGHHSDASIAELVFHIPVTSLGAYGTNGHSGNWDYFEVGIDSTEFDVVCFAQGTLITTLHGARPVEELACGDILPTAQNGNQAIKWIGSRRYSAKEQAEILKLRPVRITAGALGNGLPTRDLVVSRQHRLVVSSKIAERMFGRQDVMVAASKLTDLPGVFIDEACEGIVYFHILLDSHEAIFAEGTQCESLYFGDGTRRALDRAALEEISIIFPDLVNSNTPMPPAMVFPAGKLQKKLVHRHAKNQMPMQPSVAHEALTVIELC